VIYIFHHLIFSFNYRSVDCFRLGWPMRADADFFSLRSVQIVENNGVSNDGYFLFILICFIPFLNSVYCYLPTIPRK
jgi:hypothetical protein